MMDERNTTRPEGLGGSRSNAARAAAVAAVVVLGLLSGASAASAKNVDCRSAKFTGWAGKSNSPCLQVRQKSGPFKGKYVINGTNGADVMQGTRVSAGDLLQGLNGDDRIVGEAGNDVVVGGNGNDVLDGSGGSDHLIGGPGNDQLVADGGRDQLEGGPGNDRYVLSGSSHVISDSSGQDRLELRHFNKDQSKQQRKGNDLVVTRTVAGKEQVTIRNHFTSGKMETIQFTGKFVKQQSNSGGGGGDRDNESGKGGGGGGGDDDVSEDYADGFVDGATGKAPKDGGGKDYNSGYHDGCRGCEDV